MRKVLLSVTLLAVIDLTTFGPALAAGGMGDPSAHIRDQNALCDLQRLGKAPAYPSVCFPDDPVDPAAHGHDLNHQRF